MTSSTSFITQCPRCATKFKVTQEQLNISEGWVRCGRCQHVFDAKDHLMDGQDSPAQAGEPPQSPTEPAAPTAPADSASEPADPSTAADAPEQTAASQAESAPTAEPSAEDASATATDTESETGARPSERWLKELSDTFSPSSPTASLAIAAASAIHAPANNAAAEQAANEHAAEPLDAADKLDDAGESDALATDIPAPISSDAPAADAQTDPSPAPDAHQDGNDNDITSFHDELAQWQSKQSPFSAPASDLSETAPASAYTDGHASPVLIHASGTPAPDSDPATTSSAPAAAAESSPAPHAAPAQDTPEQATGAVAQASDAPETEEARAAREEEERLERYRAEFSETQELRFMREADQKAFWRRPFVRLGMAVLALLLLTLLAAQWAYVQRDSIAALSPQWKARMQQACAWADCRITPLQSIENLVLDGSTFQHVGGSRYVLSWTLRNRSNRWIETPALSLSLRSETGQTLVRRTITAADIAQSPPELAPAGAWKVEQHLELSDYAEAVTGYQLQIFYPDAGE